MWITYHLYCITCDRCIFYYIFSMSRRILRSKVYEPVPLYCTRMWQCWRNLQNTRMQARIYTWNMQWKWVHNTRIKSGQKDKTGKWGVRVCLTHYWHAFLAIMSENSWPIFKIYTLVCSIYRNIMWSIKEKKIDWRTRTFSSSIHPKFGLQTPHLTP